MPQGTCCGQSTTSSVGSHLQPYLEKGSLLLVLCALSRVANPWASGGLSCVCLPPPHKSTVITDAHCCAQLSLSPRCSVSGPHACTASTSYTEPSPLLRWLFWHMYIQLVKCHLSKRTFFLFFICVCAFIRSHGHSYVGSPKQLSSLCWPHTMVTSTHS